MIEDPQIELSDVDSQPAVQTEVPSPGTVPAWVPPPKSTVRDIFEMVVITTIQLLFLWTFIAQGMMVPTGSMQNTINIGDRFFANKFIFGRNTPLIGSLLPARDIKRGDIVIFKYPKDPKVNYVKRVIGMPGDEVLVRGTKVFINGKELPEQHVTVRQEMNYSALPELNTDAKPPNAEWRVYYEDGDDEQTEYISPGMKFGVSEPVRVPPDHYFVMGDNRDNSLDSRYWGFVPRDSVVGHALYVHWSFNAQDPVLRQSGSLLQDLLSRIHWKRMGTPIK